MIFSSNNIENILIEILVSYQTIDNLSEKISYCHCLNQKISVKIAAVNLKLLTFQTDKWKMGESQSKFRPSPPNLQYKNGTSGKQPRLIQSVMQAIVDLKESGGSTHSRIVEYLQGVINCKNITPRPRGLAVQVKKALKHGINNGLVKQRNTKFSMALNARDFAIFKGFRAYDPIFGGYVKKKIKKIHNCKCKLRGRSMEGRDQSIGKYRSKIASKQKNVSSSSSGRSLLENNNPMEPDPEMDEEIPLNKLDESNDDNEI